jgi:hypothetical protein
MNPVGSVVPRSAPVTARFAGAGAAQPRRAYQMHAHRATVRLSCKGSTDAGRCRRGFAPRMWSLELAIAIAQSDDESTAAFLSEDVAIRLSPAADRCFHDLCQPPGHCAEKPVPLPDDIAG